MDLFRWAFASSQTFMIQFLSIFSSKKWENYTSISFWIYSSLCTCIDQQECIPVGCVPTAAVAATRCQYQVGWGGVGWGGQTPPVNRMTDRRFWKHYLPLRSVMKFIFVCNWHTDLMLTSSNSIHSIIRSDYFQIQIVACYFVIVIHLLFIIEEKKQVLVRYWMKWNEIT